MQKVKLLQSHDIFDLYGCEYLLHKANLEDDDKQIVEFRVREIKDAYVASCRSRVIAEARYLGINVGADRSLSEILEDARTKVIEMVQKQATTGMFGYGSPNLMQTVLKAHMAAGSSMAGIDLKRFGLSEAEKPQENEMETLSNSMLKDPTWHIIAKAYLDVEAAQSIQTIISSIDKLNSLQHHSFHVLIDLQTGRMLDSSKCEGAVAHNAAATNVKDILGLRMQAKTPYIFLEKMSGDIKSLFNKYQPR